MEQSANKQSLSRFNGVSQRKRSTGFTLVEIMVSIVIFSIGLIGIARLQVVAKQSNFDAIQRITATTMAQDVLSRMRSNHSELAMYVSNNGATTLGGGTINAEPGPDCSSSGSSCNASQLAAHDLWEFEQAVDGIAELDADGNNTGGLVSPTLCITGPADGSSGVYTVAIAWRGKASLTNSNRSDCGNASGLYGANNEFRRVLVMETFITSI